MTPSLNPTPQLYTIFTRPGSGRQRRAPPSARQNMALPGRPQPLETPNYLNLDPLPNPTSKLLPRSTKAGSGKQGRCSQPYTVHPTAQTISTLTPTPKGSGKQRRARHHTAGLCLGPCGVPIGVGVSYERGTPVTLTHPYEIRPREAEAGTRGSRGVPIHPEPRTLKPNPHTQNLKPQTLNLTAFHDHSAQAAAAGFLGRQPPIASTSPHLVPITSPFSLL